MNIYNFDWIDTGDNKIHKTAIIFDNVELGKGNVIYPYAVIGWPGFIRDTYQVNGKVIIGNNNRIGCYCAIMAGESGETIIGNLNLLMNYVGIGHNSIIGSGNEIGTGSTIGGYATVKNETKIKMRATIRNRIVIGNKATIGQGANVTETVAGGMTVYGNPAKPEAWKG